MKDIGYYAGFLSSASQDAISNASLWQLADLMSDVACELYTGLSVDDNRDSIIEDSCLAVVFEDHSDRDKLALIRGLCDRIELKLMEAAK